jgi:copper chaperone
MSMKLQILDMKCGHCEATIKKEILKNDALAEIKVNLKTKEVEIKTKFSIEEIVQLLDQIGYDSKPLS